MASSFRRRLLAIAALTVVVGVAAIGALILLSRTTAIERLERARDNVTREVEALRAVLEGVPATERPRGEKQSGALQSGYVPATDAMEKGPLVVEALMAAEAAGTRVVLERADEDAPVLIAAEPVPGGGYVFAVQRVVAGRETRGLRTIVLALALLSLGLVIASLRTLTAVERGVSSLRSSLAALAKDLGAPVSHPALRELDEVAGGVAALALELRRAQQEHERLTQKLGERERLAALGRVAAGIAHEVRNPLAAMKLRADLARTGGEATPSVARDLEDIASEIARLDRLVSDLLVLAGRRAGPRVEVDIGALVERRVALASLWANERGIRFTVTGHGTASVDADAIARAVDNLLRNAVEASPTGAQVEARIASGVADEGGAVRIDVIDRGPGVAVERAAELFEPFFTTKPEGTGLGLALARAVATAHGGALTYSRDGGASCFTLTLGRVRDSAYPASGRLG
jgi:signal transduction histidine kinase